MVTYSNVLPNRYRTRQARRFRALLVSSCMDYDDWKRTVRTERLGSILASAIAAHYSLPCITKLKNRLFLGWYPVLLTEKLLFSLTSFVTVQLKANKLKILRMMKLHTKADSFYEQALIWTARWKFDIFNRDSTVHSVHVTWYLEDSLQKLNFWWWSLLSHNAYSGMYALSIKKLKHFCEGLSLYTVVSE